MTKSRSAKELNSLWQARTTMETFGRLFPKSMLTNFDPNWSFLRTSRRTRGVKDADSATTEVPGRRKARTMPSVPYFLRKCAPQCETVCASSTTRDRTRWANLLTRKTPSIKRRVCSISGEMRTTAYLPEQMSYRDGQLLSMYGCTETDVHGCCERLTACGINSDRI